MPALDLRWIYFDIDGTLCEYGSDPREVLEGICRDLGVDASLDPHAYFELYKTVARERPGEGYRTVSDEAYRRLLARAGYPDDALARQVANAYREIRLRSIDLYPETREVLEALRSRVALGIVSNGPSEIQRAKLRKFRLEAYFDPVIISGEVGLEKPEPSIFHLALGRAKARPEDAAHVGDSLVHDVAGAAGAGLTSVWINRGVLDDVGEVRPDHELADLRELLPLVGA